MKNIDSHLHTTGQSLYLDDIPVPEDCLHASVFYSTCAHGKITKLSIEKALRSPGVLGVFTAADIPGENQIGGVIPDEPLFAEDLVSYIGQPLALIVATDYRLAQEAKREIIFEADPLPVITDPREAFAKNLLICPPRTFRLGDVDSAWSKCEHVVSGRADSGGQEHLYLETQGAIAVPTENERLHITSSTQGPTAVQATVARVLGLSMNSIEVNVQRLGGGFGGKEDQATAWATFAALAAHSLKRSVKISLERMDDMQMTGRRHPYSSDFKIGLDAKKKIIAYEVTFYQDSGAAADLSPPVLGRSLFHCTNSYYIPNVKAVGACCRTNVPPNTAFRGFGGPQGMFVIEAAICKAAEQIGCEAFEIQKANLLQEESEFPYGMLAENCQASRTWETLEEKSKFTSVRKRIAKFNKERSDKKKGLAIMPICFGISFTKIPKNKASALVHVYEDGSVSVSTAAVEMGQGVNTKITQVASRVFSLDPTRIRIESTNTARVANTSPTAASSGADLNGKATELACQEILDRLLIAAAQELDVPTDQGIELKNGAVLLQGAATNLSWEKLISKALLKRVNLSAHVQYATPRIHFDRDKEKGLPFAYHVYGTALFEATLDVLRGRYEFDSAIAVHDFGTPFNRLVDLGQAEGGLVQGLGWMTMEEVLYGEDGRLLSNALSTYKVPDIYSAPKTIEIHFLPDAPNPYAVFNSKAIGEPPLMYGIGAYFALRDAIQAFHLQRDGAKSAFALQAPMTPERALLGLYPEKLTEKPTAS